MGSLPEAKRKIPCVAVITNEARRRIGIEHEAVEHDRRIRSQRERGLVEEGQLGRAVLFGLDQLVVIDVVLERERANLALEVADHRAHHDPGVADRDLVADRRRRSRPASAATVTSTSMAQRRILSSGRSVERAALCLTWLPPCRRERADRLPRLHATGKQSPRSRPCLVVAKMRRTLGQTAARARGPAQGLERVRRGALTRQPGGFALVHPGEEAREHEQAQISRP